MVPTVTTMAPGKYSYASSGSGSPHHVFMELLKKQLGLDIVHVPYKGSSSSMTDLLASLAHAVHARGAAVHVATWTPTKRRPR